MNDFISNCKKDTRDLMLTAGETVGLDLKNPIDCSQMMVMQEGEREELTITFELKSQRAPKLTKQ